MGRDLLGLPHAFPSQFAFRGLAKAEESFLRINEDGMLNLHHRVVQQEDGEDAFVSFIMLPDEVGVVGAASPWRPHVSRLATRLTTMGFAWCRPKQGRRPRVTSPLLMTAT